ncbi:MAG: ARMT1-like domain-containing protein [Candidatus Cloacimonetes bacterium]|nr:ARMT1-like domain-containing protein [Candidatus Cloacimonadota bacterium]
MKTYLECLPCFMNQALRAGRIATEDETIVKKLLNEVGMMIPKIPMEQSPPETGTFIYRKISELTGNSDPYRQIKNTNISKALELYPKFKKMVLESEDCLLMAIRIAIAGNIIDLGTGKKFDIEKDIDKVLHQDLAIFHYTQFKEKLEKANKILYIADNAGEAVFDKILIEELGKPVHFIVREIPVINDVTMKEAKIIGIDRIANVISSGSLAPGTILKNCDKNFVEMFRNADLIISKGQGNYESLSNEAEEIFFLLKAKCNVIARDLGVKENDIVLKYSKK